MALVDLTVDQLIDLEERLYDMEVEGLEVWFERDQVLLEMNTRGLMNTKPRERLDEHEGRVKPG
jgi:hypothetical protein